MAARQLSFRELRRILLSFGIQENPSRGKGSHSLFFAEIDGAKVSYPIPSNRKDVLACYVSGARRRFKLTVADGISDDDFYGRA